jgi:mannosyltransferase OCH1-like enzyme
MIPRILHFVWLANPMPPLFARWRSEWATLHPGWRFVDWSIDNLPGEAPPANCCHVRQQSNWVRLQALWLHGGVYVDHDTQPLRNLEPILSGHTAAASPFFGRALDSPRCCNSFLAATPRHPWLSSCLELLNAADPTVHLSMGSSLISHALSGRSDVHVLDRNAILQRPGWRRLGRQPPGECYAIHHFANMDPQIQHIEP